jgi:3D (Asp-Asp-Asp) domain-containing protein
VRVRSRRPLLLVVLALALPAAHAGTAAAATAPREQAALVDLFATDAALARAQASASAAHSQLTFVRGRLASVRQRLHIARSNELATQRALAARLNEIYRAHPLDTLGVLLAARSFAQISDGLDLLDRLSRQDSDLVRSARRWHAALQGSSGRLRAAADRARAVQGAWESRVAALGEADRRQRSLLARLRRQHVRSLNALAATARRAARRARTIVRPEPHGGGSTSTPAHTATAAQTTTDAPATTAAIAAPAPPAPAPARPSLAPGTTLSVASTAYSLPGHTASGLPVGLGICATDPRVIPLGTRFDVPGYGSCVAADTGSAVIGATIDIWMPGAQASVYGRQTITITFR